MTSILNLLLVVTAVMGMAPMASAEDFRLVPEMTFEHRFYENGDEDFFVRRDGVELNYRPTIRILSIGGHLIDLSGKIYESLDEADFTQVIFFQAESDKIFFGAEFGFGGLLRSGIFQKIRGKLLFHLDIASDSAVQYIAGSGVRCDSPDGVVLNRFSTLIGQKPPLNGLN
jgi:hypothetical protein